MKIKKVVALCISTCLVLILGGLYFIRRPVPEELIGNIEQWVEEYPWAEKSSLIAEETCWIIERIEFAKGNDTGDVYDVDVDCISQDRMWELWVGLLVDPDTLEILDMEGYMINSALDRPAAPTEEKTKEDVAEVAPISGDALSPDGAYEVRLSGVIESMSSDETVAAELVQIRNVQTGEVLWEGTGAYEHAVVWSPNGKKLALARTTRTGSTVTVVETERWTVWDVTIPGTDYWNQIPIPEYTYLPDNGDWLDWVNTSEFRLTLGRGGDAGEKTDYHVILSGGFPLNGSALFMEAELLPTEYDLDHDGSPERLERMFVRESEDGPVSFFKLHVLGNDDILLWSGEAHTAHAGWNTYFVCTLDGQDYLLEYDPYMSGGVCYYSYRLFSLGPDGEEMLYKENMLDFDINPASKVMNHNFDADAIADFVDEVNKLLAHSKLLLTTDDAVRDMDPNAPVETLWWLRDDSAYGYDETKTMWENLKAMETFLASI